MSKGGPRRVRGVARPPSRALSNPIYIQRVVIGVTPSGSVSLCDEPSARPAKCRGDAPRTMIFRREDGTWRVAHATPIRSRRLNPSKRWWTLRRHEGAD